MERVLGFAWSVVAIQLVWAALIALLLMSAGCSGDSCDAPAGWFIATIGFGQVALIPFSTIATLYLFGRWMGGDHGY